MLFERICNFYKLQNAIGVKSDNDVTLIDNLRQSDTQCQLMLDALQTSIFPLWHTRGEVPRLSLRPLLELVELYFSVENDHKSFSTFSQEVLDWAKSLPECVIHSSHALDDIYCLYGQMIQVKEKSVYLIEILLDCLEPHTVEHDDKIKGIAHWLVDYDASFIANVPELIDIYSQMKVGPAFTIEELGVAVQALPVSNSRVRDGINVLVRYLPLTDKFDSSKVKGIVKVLHEIFRLRCLQQSETGEVGYLGDQQGDNRPWIRLAQLVCGAGWLEHLRDNMEDKGNLTHFKENYYRLLIPSIKCDTDPVQLNGIANYALSHLILSHSGRYLILLDTSVAQFHVSEKFYNWNTRQPRPLTDVEIERMQFSDLKAYIPQALYTTKTEDLSISKHTIIGLKALVEGSFYIKGLYLEDYPDAEKELAGRALHLFYNFLKQLPADERERLLKQRIILDKKNKTVDEIFDHVDNDGEDRCIAGCAEILTQLLLDYNPHERLIPELEARVKHYKMREHSRKKVYRDYDAIDASEAKRRILILAVSLLSQRFPYQISRDTISLWDCSNTLAGVGKNIFKLIKPMIKSNNFEHARHVYATIIESLAKPAVVNQGKSWFFFRQPWLESVANESLFKQPSGWFEPKFLFTILSPIVQLNLPISALLQEFLDQVIYTYVQTESELLKEVRVNIIFSKLLNSQEANVGEELLKLIKSSRPQENEYQEPNFREYVIRRLALVGATSLQWSMGFFGQRTVCDKQRLTELTLVLENRTSSLLIGKLNDFKHIVETMTHLVCNPDEKSSMMHYLEAMTNGTVASYSDGSKSPLPLLYSEFFSIGPG